MSMEMVHRADYWKQVAAENREEAKFFAELNDASAARRKESEENRITDLRRAEKRRREKHASRIANEHRRNRRKAVAAVVVIAAVGALFFGLMWFNLLEASVSVVCNVTCLLLAICVGVRRLLPEVMWYLNRRRKGRGV